MAETLVDGHVKSTVRTPSRHRPGPYRQCRDCAPPPSWPSPRVPRSCSPSAWWPARRSRYAEAGHEVALARYPLTSPRPLAAVKSQKKKNGALKVTRNDSTLTVANSAVSASFSLTTGRLTALTLDGRSVVAPGMGPEYSTTAGSKTTAMATHLPASTPTAPSPRRSIRMAR